MTDADSLPVNAGAPDGTLEAPAPLAPLPDPAPGRLAPVARIVPRRFTPHWPTIGLAMLALAASANSLFNAFAYDDRWIIVDSNRVHTLNRLWHAFAETYWPLLNGGGLWRPLAIISYALQWAAAGGRPWIFHATSVGLYVAVTVALYRLTRRLLGERAAWPAVALFAVHPVHVEAVANAVGQSELVVALLALVSIDRYVAWRAEGAFGWRRAGALLAMFTAGLLFKEHAILIPALLGVAELLLVADRRPGWVARARPIYLAFVALTLVYLRLRVGITGGVGGDTPHPAFAGLTMAGRAVGMLGVVPEWARLLVWPASLSADYSPAQTPLAEPWSAEMFQGLFILLGVAIMFVVGLRRSRPAAFGIAIIALCLAPVANVLIATGIVMAERTLFLPSAGFILVVGVGLAAAQRHLGAEPLRTRRLAEALLAVVVALGAWRSANRSRVWRNNDTLFRQMIADAPYDFKAHYAYGGLLFERGRAHDAEREWRMAIQLLPTYHGVYADLANQYRAHKLCGPAVPLYEKALSLKPSLTYARTGLVACYIEQRRYREARIEARRGMAYGVDVGAYRPLAAVADSAIRHLVPAAPAPRAAAPAGVNGR